MRLWWRYEWREDTSWLRVLGTLPKRRRYSARDYPSLIQVVLLASWSIFFPVPGVAVVLYFLAIGVDTNASIHGKNDPTLSLLSLVRSKLNVGDPSLRRRSSRRSDSFGYEGMRRPRLLLAGRGTGGIGWDHVY